jgi:hypothetical protein
VHELQSSQLFGVYLHCPLTQVSVVHAFLSSQAKMCSHFPLTHLSVVHLFPSQQFIGVLTHPFPGTQESVVQGFLSLQRALFGVLVHPVFLLQESTVQATPSLQFLGVLTIPLLASQVWMVHLSGFLVGIGV